MFTRLATKRIYPWAGEIRGRKFTFRPVTPADRKDIIAFTSGLSRTDILFLQTDITKPEVIDEWISHVERGRAIVLLVLDSSGRIAGYASLYRNESLWTRHQVEIRLFVGKPWRSTGVGKQLASEIIAVAEEQNPDIIVVNVPREHPHIRMMLEKEGFNVEALLTDWLVDTDGKTHDLLVMARRMKDL